MTARIRTGWSPTKHRRGLAALEVVAMLGTVFVIAVTLYWMAERSFGGLYHVISVCVGAPCL